VYHVQGSAEEQPLTDAAFPVKITGKKGLTTPNTKLATKSI